MNRFGTTIRDLRLAQQLSLRDTASKVGISPAYLSRIERGKEGPPRPEIIKAIAKRLAADPDVLFRLSASTDPDLVELMLRRPTATTLLRYLQEQDFTEEEIDSLLDIAQNFRSTKT